MSTEDEAVGKLNIIKGHLLHPTLIAKTNCELEVLSKTAPDDGEKIYFILLMSRSIVCTFIFIQYCVRKVE